MKADYGDPMLTLSTASHSSNSEHRRLFDPESVRYILNGSEPCLKLVAASFFPASRRNWIDGFSDEIASLIAESVTSPAKALVISVTYYSSFVHLNHNKSINFQMHPFISINQILA